jgi:hypothetical protein
MKPYKHMGGMEMLTKINAPKKKAENSLQNLGRAIATHEAAKKNTTYGKRTTLKQGAQTFMKALKNFKPMNDKGITR